jgi:cystathionine beta-lyase
MTYDFDECINRRHTDSLKWNYYDEEVLPMWVADMDFRSPDPVIRELHERVEHGVFGYGWDPPELREVFADRLQGLYDWEVSPEALVFLPGVVTAFNLVCHAFGAPGDGVRMQTPVYLSNAVRPRRRGAYKRRDGTDAVSRRALRD